MQWVRAGKGCRMRKHKPPEKRELLVPPHDPPAYRRR